MKRIVSVLVVAMGISVGLAAQQHAASGMPAKKTDGDAAKVQRALAAGPADMTKGAAVVEVDAKGAMHELRKGTNGWTCMLFATGESGPSEAMCGDKPWMDWGDAYM